MKNSMVQEVHQSGLCPEQYRRYEGLVTVDDIEKMIQVIAHIFEKPEEVTPLMLQQIY